MTRLALRKRANWPGENLALRQTFRGVGGTGCQDGGGSTSGASGGRGRDEGISRGVGRSELRASSSGSSSEPSSPDSSPPLASVRPESAIHSVLVAPSGCVNGVPRCCRVGDSGSQRACRCSIVCERLGLVVALWNYRLASICSRGIGKESVDGVIRPTQR